MKNQKETRNFSSENNPFFNAEIRNLKANSEKQAERFKKDFRVKLCENGCSKRLHKTV